MLTAPLSENHNVNTQVTFTITTDLPVYERIFNAYKTDTDIVSKQAIDFNQWAVNCLLDWVQAVEIESTRNG